VNRPHAFAARAYLTLLRAYPPAFRDRFADGMVEAFVQELDAARARGLPATIAVWATTVIDAARFGVLERIEQSRGRRVWHTRQEDGRCDRCSSSISGMPGARCARRRS
jgi:hypothetical protein